MKTVFVVLFVVYFFILDTTFICCNDSTAKSDKSTSSALTKKFGDENVVLSLVKSLVEFASNGFKTGLEASVRSIFNKPLTSAVYAISMLVGVVAMLAFYESPISPLPVPPLPDPPVGRFPPENPVWPPPNAKRTQGYINAPYNQRRNGPSIMSPIAAGSMQAPSYYPLYFSENHRSDKNNAASAMAGAINVASARVKPHIPAANPILPSHHYQHQLLPQLNETSYNNFISKLTSGTDLNANPNVNAHGIDAQTLKQVFGSTNAELSNKVFDYNNKRIAVESLKYGNGNQTVS